jgi:hypothetical protein
MPARAKRKRLQHNPDKPENFLATEVTENTERNEKWLISKLLFSLSLCPLCALWQNILAILSRI